MGLLYVLYRNVPRLVPYTVKLARLGIVIVAALMLPCSIYCTIRGFPTYSRDWPVWLLRVMVTAGLGTFVLFVWAAVVLFVDAKRMPNEDGG